MAKTTAKTDWRSHLSYVLPMFFTSRFKNHNGRHWWVWWVQWHRHILLRGGHREECCISGVCSR